MKAITNTWKTLTDSLSVVGKYGSYYLYPLLSYIILLLATFTVIIPLLEGVLGANQNDVRGRIFFFLAVYLAYGVLYFVIGCCNVALVGVAARLDGGAPRLSVGIVCASQRIGLIAVYTLVSATLGLLSFLARTLIDPIFGTVIAPAIGNRLWVRWQKLSYSAPLLMEVPIIALDQPAPRDAFKRSDRLIKETWGEHVEPAHSIGLLALLVLLPIILFVAMPTLQQGAAAHDAGLIRRGLSIMLIAIGTYTQLSALVNTVFALAAYRYATARKSDVLPGDPTYAEHAFVKSKKQPTLAQRRPPRHPTRGQPPTTRRAERSAQVYAMVTTQKNRLIGQCARAAAPAPRQPPQAQDEGSMSTSGHTIAHYRIRIDGHLDSTWSDWFDGLCITQENDGTTTLEGALVDQAALYGLLSRLRDLGATLLSVELKRHGSPIKLA
jgi:hypothetical protein